MNIEKITRNGQNIAVISSAELLITDVQSAVDLLMDVKYNTGAARIAINKEAIIDKFFVLSSGLAGEILQKFVTYQVKLAIYGDYSQYTSKPLRDFIYESNQGRDVFFVDDRESALQKLAAAV